MDQSSRLTDSGTTQVLQPPNLGGVAERRKKRAARMRWARRGLLVLLALAIVGAIALAWMPRAQLVDLAAVERGPMRVTVDEDGKTRVKDRYTVSAPLAGDMSRIDLRAGDAVEAGQVVGRLAPVAPPLLDERTRTTAQARLSAALAAQKQAAAQIERARATAEYTKSDTDRKRELFRRSSIPRAEMDRAEFAERTATADLDSAKFAERVAAYDVAMARSALRHVLDSGRGNAEEEIDIPSPIGGRVLAVMNESEGVVQPGTPLLEIGDPSALEIVVDVVTSDAVLVHQGARVVLDGWGGEPLEGRVRRVEPSAFTRLSALGVEEQRVNVLIDLESPREKWSALNDGYRVEAHIVVWEASDVMKVPSSAVFRRGDDWGCFRVEQDVARLTRIRIGHRTAREVEIVDTNLDAGAEVILHPSDQIVDGVKVKER